MKKQLRRSRVKRVVFGQPSWCLSSAEVVAFISERGGHIGPVTFYQGGRSIKPYSVAPWAEETNYASLPPVIRALRGDFFCLPFGGNSTPFRGERHPVHGETANAIWRFESLTGRAGRKCLHLSLVTEARQGRVDKMIYVVEGQSAIYTRHVISEMNGPMSLGHHAMLKFPDIPGSGLVSTSRFILGQVVPGPFELPEKQGYCALKGGAEFSSLKRVPALAGGSVDLTRYPARRGFEDLVMLVSDPKTAFAWSAVSFPEQRYVWFALKNPRILRQTILWISNGGRHYPPWNGRHVNVMGIEDVTSFFHLGLAESVRKNAISSKGFRTHIELKERKPLTVPYISGVAETPGGFDRVISIRPTMKNRAIILKSANGKTVTAGIELDFLENSSADEGWQQSMIL